MQPEILILQVDKVLCVAQRVYIELCNTLDAWPGVEPIGVLWDSPGDLHQAFALYRGWERGLGDEELAIPTLPPDNIVPALAEIESYVCFSQAFNDGMRVVPGMRAAIFCILTQRRCAVMQ